MSKKQRIQLENFPQIFIYGSVSNNCCYIKLIQNRNKVKKLKLNIISIILHTEVLILRFLTFYRFLVSILGFL